MSNATFDSLHRLSDGDREHLRRLVEEHGVAGAARLLGLSRSVVASAAGGLGVRRGSLELVKDALATTTGKGEK